jgi:hypothetical protein
VAETEALPAQSLREAEEIVFDKASSRPERMERQVSRVAEYAAAVLKIGVGGVLRYVSGEGLVRVLGLESSRETQADTSRSQVNQQAIPVSAKGLERAIETTGLELEWKAPEGLGEARLVNPQRLARRDRSPGCVVIGGTQVRVEREAAR